MPSRDEVLQMLWERPVEVGRWVGFTDLGDLHNEWLRSFLYADGDQTLQAHRGSFKTTTLSLFFALHTVLFPNESVLYFRKTDSDVMEIAEQTKKILLSGCMQSIVYALYGHKLTLTRSNATEISTNLATSIRGASQIVGLGIGTSITGKHADIIVTDDIVNLRDRTSKAERERIKRAYMELQNIKNRGGRFINTGTPWHKDDAFILMPNIKQYDCYSTGLISEDERNALRKSMSSSLFAANYELKHIADEDAMFTDPHYTSDTASIYDGQAHIDAAYGGADSTAYTVIKRRPDGKLTAYGKLWGKHVDDCLGDISRIHEELRAGSIACEKNADKGYLQKELRSLGFKAVGYSEKMNKHIKISTYLKAHWDDIEWLESTDPEYMNMILDYNEFAEHDDAPDSAASLIRRLVKNGRDTEAYVPLLERQRQRGGYAIR